MSNKMALDALRPCPFCGKSDTLVIGKASDAFAEPDECGDPLPYMHTEAYAVTCDASKPEGPGGCGASGGYKLTEAEAVAAWNERAAIAALEAEPQPAIPEGWGFSSADFSLQASGVSEFGGVMLIRTGADRADWHALTDEQREVIPLYVSGTGRTVAEAIASAAKNCTPLPRTDQP